MKPSLVLKREDAVIYHELEAVIAKVSSATAARVDRQIGKARRLAALLAALAGELGEYMHEEEAVDIATLRGARALRLVTSFRQLKDSAARFRIAYEGNFLAEHGALVDEETRATIGLFLAWIEARYGALHARAAAYLETRNAQLGADKDHLADLAAEWSAVDADGLD